MNKTITLPALLPADPVFLSLRHRGDEELCWRFVCLLAWAALYRPGGDLRDVPYTSLASASGAPMDPEEAERFVAELKACGALTEDGFIADAFVPKKDRVSDRAAVPSCPTEAIIKAYHEALPMLPKVRTMSTNTGANLRAAWRAEPERQSLDWWRDYFRYVAESCPFLIGRAGNEPFFADFAWLIGPKNMEKVINGRYHVGGSRRMGAR